MPYPNLIPDFNIAEIRERLNADSSCVLDTVLGESVFDRGSFNVGNAISASQRLVLVGLTARTTQNISQVRVMTSTTAAGATPTLCRIGVYQRNTDNSYTLVASTANDTALFAATNTTYTKSFSSSFLKTAGTDYLVGILVVTGAALPSFVAPTGSALTTAYATDFMLVQPSTSAAISGQADLPATITAGTLVNSTLTFHALLMQ